MSLYRDHELRCPHCCEELVHMGPGAACGACRGMWIDEAKLDEMVREMHDGQGALRFDDRTVDRVVACPACGEAQLGVTLHGVPLERCGRGHGVWFDADELQAALRAAGMAEPAETRAEGDAPDVRIGFWRGLFGAIGGLLGIAGYAAVGVAGAAVAGSHVTSALDDRQARERTREVADALKKHST